MIIDRKLAEQLIEAFGPGTGVYECMSPEDVIESVAEFDRLIDWANVEFEVENIMAERSYGWLGDDPSKAAEHKAAIRESKDFRAAMRKRVRGVVYPQFRK